MIRSFGKRQSNDAGNAPDFFIEVIIFDIDRADQLGGAAAVERPGLQQMMDVHQIVDNVEILCNISIASLQLKRLYAFI